MGESLWALWAWRATFVIALVAALAVWYWLSRRQRRLAERVLRVVVTNRGNIRSRYALEAESPDGALRLAFAVGEGDTLVPQAGEELTGLWKKGMQAGSSGAGFLNSLGDILPRPLGKPLLWVARRIHRGQSEVRHVEQTTHQAGQLRAQVARRKPAGQNAAVKPLAPQTETGYLSPGESLTLRLLALPARLDETRLCPVVVRSRSLEQEESEWVVTEGQVPVVGLTPFQRYGPYLVIPAVALSILFVSSLVCSLW